MQIKMIGSASRRPLEALVAGRVRRRQTRFLVEEREETAKVEVCSEM